MTGAAQKEFDTRFMYVDPVKHVQPGIGESACLLEEKDVLIIKNLELPGRSVI